MMLASLSNDRMGPLLRVWGIWLQGIRGSVRGRLNASDLGGPGGRRLGLQRLMGEDDERTARDVRRLQALVGTVAAELGGRAGRRRAIAARSESVLSALQAVVPCRSSSLARRRPSDSSG